MQLLRMVLWRAVWMP